jgi:uncharacterized protein
LQLSIQTNGTLLNDRWIDVFVANQVNVGVSIDGGRDVNDRFRLNKRGHSTFQRTEHAIRLLVDANKFGVPAPSTISVLDPSNDYRAVYQFLRGLGVSEMSFLLPDRNADDRKFVSSGSAAKYGSCLSDIFLEWLKEDNLEVKVRFIENILIHFKPHPGPRVAFRRTRKSNQIVIARSDGTVAIDDSFIPALDWYSRAPIYKVADRTLRDFLSVPIFGEIEDICNTLPGGCAECRWRDMCRSGDLENRFSTSNGFDNPSVYCDAYKVLFAEVCDTLACNGYPPDLISAKFGRE